MPFIVVRNATGDQRRVFPERSHYSQQYYSKDFLQEVVTHKPINPTWNYLKRKESENEVNISIPGVRKMLDPQSKIWLRIFWFFAIVSCTVVCFYQLSNRVRYYLQKPVSIKISMERFQQVYFPALTLCPSWPEDMIKVPNCSEDQNLCLDHASVETIWEKNSISSSAVQIVTACSRKRNTNFMCNFESFPAYFTKMDTIWGRCLVISFDGFMEYRGPQTYLKILINESMFEYNDTNSNRKLLQYFVNDWRVSYRHDALFIAEDAVVGFSNHVRLMVKQFNFVNSSSNSCLSLEEATRCRNSCIDKILEGISSCSLPFMESTKPMCDTMRDISDAYFKVYAFYVNMTSAQCTCSRNCNEYVYSLMAQVLNNGEYNGTSITLYYPDNLLETVEETYSYSLPALLSDIGGNLGFLLGCSVLTALEVFESIIKRSYQRLSFCKRNT